MTETIDDRERLAYGQTVWSLTDADRVSALALAQAGKVFDLGVPMSRDMPQGPTETFGGFRISPYRTPLALSRPIDPPAFDFSMEIVTGSIHQGSHIDGLAHIHCDGLMNGGYRTAEEYHDFGWRKNGAEHIPPIIARGVLLDVAGVIGPDPLPDSFEIQPEHLDHCCRQHGVELHKGDVVLVRTGRIAAFKNGSEDYFANAPGVGRTAAIWLYDKGMVALGTDTSGTEPHPIVDPSASTHESMLVDRGVLLLEILDLDALAAAGVHEFLFACLPLPLVGATGSWVRPVAII